MVSLLSLLCVQGITRASSDDLPRIVEYAPAMANFQGRPT
jgi:hypothetical protein